MSVRSMTGVFNRPDAGRADTLRDYDPLPPELLIVEESTKERAATCFVTVFLSVWFLIPFVMIGVILHFR